MSNANWAIFQGKTCNKCADGNSAGCLGLEPGIDTDANGPAFCLGDGANEAQLWCDRLAPYCKGFEINAATGRTFFNMDIDGHKTCSEFAAITTIAESAAVTAASSLAECQANVASNVAADYVAYTEETGCMIRLEQLHSSTEYDYYQISDGANDGGQVDTTDTTAAASTTLLNFRQIEFSSGGTFKVCYCDSDLLPNNVASCTHHSHFTIEVGKVHASGVTCLIRESRFQRGVCASQTYGGLRCYEAGTDIIEE